MTDIQREGRLPSGITVGNLVNTAVTIAAAGLIFWGQWQIYGYRVEQLEAKDREFMAAYDRTVSEIKVSIDSVRTNYATVERVARIERDAGQAAIEARLAVAPMTAKIDTLVDRVGKVEQNQAEQGATLRAMQQTLGDLRRAIDRTAVNRFRPPGTTGGGSEP